MKPQTRRTERGQSLLELAVGMTVLLILLAGIVDLGRALFYYISMRDASEEALSYGLAFPTHCDQIVDRAFSSMDGSTTLEVTVTVNGKPCKSASKTADACAEKEMIVNVDQPSFGLSMPLIGTFIGTQTLHLQAESRGQILRPECQ